MAEDTKITHCIVRVSDDKDDKDQPRKVIMGAVYNAGETFTIPVKDALKLEKDGAVRIVEQLSFTDYEKRLVGTDVDKHGRECQCSYHVRNPRPVLTGAKA